MGKIAFIFPGQGAQYPGMGRDFYESFEKARIVMDSYEKESPGLLDMIFSANAETLMETGNTQKALYAVETAIDAVLKSGGLKADAAAGFSLGELAALASAGAYSYLDGFRIVSARADLMKKAAEKTKAGMLAVLKLDDETVEEIASRFPGVYPVNYNAPGQVVISSLEERISDVEKEVKENGGRTMRLSVSGGFHSPFMDSAAEGFSEALEGFSFSEPSIPIWANLTGELYSRDIKGMLSRQINSPVRWSKTIMGMAESGIDAFIEIGPGTTLSNLIKRIDKSVRTFSVSTAEDAEALKEALGC